MVVLIQLILEITKVRVIFSRSIKMKNSPENQVHKVYVDPKKNATDRGEQSFNLDLNASAEWYIFEVTTKEGINARWGWRYWRF
jgi:hypothetical protein